jgi:16S rRNA (guanine527-N7)-methyltransferase
VGITSAAGSPALTRALERARTLGFLGPGDLGPHIDHALGFVTALVAAQGVPVSHPDDGGPGSVLDLGSGGGLPGLVLAERWTGSSFVLLDASERRTAFLVGAVEDLGLSGRVAVVRDRAESAGRRPELRGAFDVVTARSFGSPPVTAECAAPFLRPGGLLLVSEPPPATGDSPDGDPGDDLAQIGGPGRWPAGPLRELGLQDVGGFGDGFRFRVLRQLAPCPERYPRRVGVPAKRPLYPPPGPA